MSTAHYSICRWNIRYCVHDSIFYLERQMTRIATLDAAWRDFVSTQSHQNVNRCFDCARCTAGCPVAFAMEHGPHRILEMVRFGLQDAVLASPDIWLCAGCET